MNRRDTIIILDAEKNLHYVFISEIPIHQRAGVGIRIPAPVVSEPELATLVDSKVEGDLCIITAKGKFFRLSIQKIWDFTAKKKTKIELITQYPNMYNNNDFPVSMFFIEKERYMSDEYLIIATIAGRVKKMSFNLLSKIELGKVKGFKCISLVEEEDDVVSCTCFTRDGEDLFLCSSTGFVCRFDSDSLQSTSPDSYGIICQQLNVDNAYLAAICSAKAEDGDLFFSSGQLSKGKVVDVSSYRHTNKGKRRGVISITLESCDLFNCSFVCKKTDQIICLTSEKRINRFPVSSIPVQIRKSQGVRIIDLKGTGRLVTALLYSC